MTNWDAVGAIAGDDTLDWPGHRIELYPSTTTMKGSPVDCIRIRPPKLQKTKAKAAAMAATADDDLDDDIPF
jgi:hypothetical protein